MDILVSNSLPVLEEVRKRYEIGFDNYSILLFHPVTTELKNLRSEVEDLVDCILEDERNYVVIYPNNDEGTDTILYEYNRFKSAKNCRLFPSMRFEHFLTLLKNSQFIIGNSSAGIREAPFYGVPCINIGTRQANRGNAATVLNSGTTKEEIKSALTAVENVERKKEALFGKGKSNELFVEILEKGEIWAVSTQKYFVDLN
jgi:UDP-N-acetylglucosamine 2-epimerase (hydrolysing)